MSVETTWVVTGMHCGGCARRVKNQLQEKVTDLVDADIDPKAGLVRLVTAAAPDETGIREAVASAGYTFVGARL